VLDTLFWIVSLNMLLAVFNLLPIPPLDGYNVALAFLPPRQAMLLRSYAQYGVFILLGLVLLSYVNSPIDPLGWILAIAAEIAFILVGE
jgi:Zn-dependent protease